MQWRFLKSFGGQMVFTYVYLKICKSCRQKTEWRAHLEGEPSKRIENNWEMRTTLNACLLVPSNVSKCKHVNYMLTLEKQMYNMYPSAKPLFLCLLYQPPFSCHILVFNSILNYTVASFGFGSSALCNFHSIMKMHMQNHRCM